MAPGHAHVLALRRLLVDAGVPGHDAVGAGVDGRRRHRQRIVHAVQHLRRDALDPRAGDRLVHRPHHVRLEVAAERAADGDDPSDVLRRRPGDLAGVDAPEAVADHADRFAGGRRDLRQPPQRDRAEPVQGEDLRALPRVHLVAELGQVAAQHGGEPVPAPNGGMATTWCPSPRGARNSSGSVGTSVAASSGARISATR